FVAVIALVSLLSVRAVLPPADNGRVVVGNRIVDPWIQCVVEVLCVNKDGRSLLTPGARVLRVAGRNGLLPVAFSVLALIALIALVSLLSVHAVLPPADDGRVVVGNRIVDPRNQGIVV